MSDTPVPLAEQIATETPLQKRIGDLMMDGVIPEWAAEQLDELHRVALSDIVEAARGLFDNIAAITTSTHEADDAIDALKAALPLPPASEGTKP